jgi:methionyl-tRNA formyltransferase
VEVKLVSESMPDIIVSYGHRFILPPEVFALPPLGAINLHISYLPWNRGADPNFWSLVENTPRGVSIHYIDAGIDTGDVIARAPVGFSEADTLRTSYDRLHTELRALFAAWWREIRLGLAPRGRQAPGGTFHLRSDREPFEHLLAARGWNTPVCELAGLRLDHGKIHERNRRHETA